MDTTTVYFSEHARSYIPVAEMEPHHARNALAKVLRDPAWAAVQIANPRNRHLQAMRDGLRYVIEVDHPSPSGVFTVPTFAPRRAAARQMRRAYHALGLASRLYRVDEMGKLEQVR